VVLHREFSASFLGEHDTADRQDGLLPACFGWSSFQALLRDSSPVLTIANACAVRADEYLPVLLNQYSPRVALAMIRQC
jgi:hypothetical protein